MDRKVKTTALVLMLPLFAAAQTKSEKPLRLESAQVATILLPAFQKIKKQTNIPVLLPGKLPSSVKEKEIRPVDGRVRADGWDISLSTQKGCDADSCFIGLFEARIGEKVDQEEGDKAVRLANGIEGYYTARSCSNSCSPPQIKWKYKDAIYTIQFNVDNKNKNRDKVEMVALANSAIAGGFR